MKAAYYILVAASLLRCPGVQAQVQPEKRRSVYLTIKGPEESAAKLRGLFADMALEKDLWIVEDPHKAGAKVSITIFQERKVEKPLYAEVVAATLVSREGTSFPLYSCRKVTDGGGYSTITTKSGKANLPKDPETKRTVWIDKKNTSPSLLEAVTREIINADFEVVLEEKDAEFTLRDIRLMKQTLRVNTLEAKVQSVLSPASGSPMTLDSDVISYLSVVEPIGAAAEGCRDSLRHVGDESSMSYQQVAAIDITLIARQIK